MVDRILKSLKMTKMRKSFLPYWSLYSLVEIDDNDKVPYMCITFKQFYWIDSPGSSF